MAQVDDIDEVVTTVSELAAQLRGRQERGERSDREKIHALRDAADRLHAIARGLADERIQGPIKIWPVRDAFVLASGGEGMDRRDAPTIRIRPVR
jgi:hypothetical protein